jgi:predicted GIY-YIG superfamily endonuclease
VYVLRCLRNGRAYVGFTNDLARRFAEHSSPPPRMRDDALRFTPFCDHFTITAVEADITTQLIAKRRETYHIQQLRATTAAGYNEAPGSTTRAWWYRKRHNALARC